MRSYWHQAPLFRVAIPFGAGIAVGSTRPLANVSPWIPMGIGVFLLLIIIFYRSNWKEFKRRYQFGTLVFGVFLCLGSAAVLSRIHSLQADVKALPNTGSFVAQVETIPQKRQNSIRVELKLKGQLDSSGLFQENKQMLMAYGPLGSELDTLLPGDLLVFSDAPAPVQKPLNPKQFDYGNYLFRKGITGTVYLRSGAIALPRSFGTVTPSYVFQRLQKAAVGVFDGFDFGPKELGVVSALVLGERDLVDPDTRTAYADAGTVHILAVSGLHVGIIYLFLAFVMGKVLPGKRFKVTRLLVTLSFLWMYAGVTGFSPSVLRAATMFSFVALGRNYGQFGSVYNMLAASSFVLLMANPFLLFEVGFQLSYLAVLGIVSMYPKIFPLLASGNRVWDKVWGLAVVSFSAQVATFPLSIYYFGQFPNYFLFTNLLVIPLATIVLYLGISVLLLSWIPYLSDALAIVLKYALKSLNGVVDFSSALPFAVSKGLYFSISAVLLAYIIVFFLFKTYADPRHGNLKVLGASVLLLALLQATSLYRAVTRVGLTVAHTNGYTAIVGVNGGHVRIWTDAYPDNLEKLQFSIDGLIRYYKPRTINYAGLQESFANERFWSDSVILAAGDQVIALVQNSRDIPVLERLNPAAFLWKGKANELMDDSLGLFNIPIIIDGSMPSYRQDELSALSDGSARRLWFTKEQGAFIVATGF